MVAEGVCRASCGVKNTFNALDNADVSFDRVRVGRNGLLSGQCSMDEEGTYTHKGPRPPSFLTVLHYMGCA